MSTSILITGGADFDFHAGTIKRAPVWMQRHALEWFFRLLQEPQRLSRRYLTTNTIFLFKFFLELTRVRILSRSR